MNFRKTLPFALGALTLCAFPAHGELVYNVGVFSDYIDNGESRTENNAVVQGGAEYLHESGLFTGAQISTLGENEGQEIIPFIGYGFAIEDVELSLAYEHSYFSELSGETYEGEVIAEIGYGPFMAGVEYMATAHDSDIEDSVVYLVGTDFEVQPGISLDATVGLDDARGEPSTAFWEVGTTRSTDLGDISLGYASRDTGGAQHLFVAGYSISF